MGVGYDRVDRVACAAHGIKVCNVPDYGTMEVAEFAVLLALSLRRGLLLYHDGMRQAAPIPWAVQPSTLHRRQQMQRFGILGLGRIGTAAALRAKAFGYEVAFFDPYQPNGWERALGIGRVRSLEALLEQSDVLSIHCPLTRTTRGLINEAALRRLPRNAVLVNTARGPIVDLDAVERVLRDGHLAGAGLDVIPDEPPQQPEPVPATAAARPLSWPGAPAAEAEGQGRRAARPTPQRQRPRAGGSGGPRRGPVPAPWGHLRLRSRRSGQRTPPWKASSEGRRGRPDISAPGRRRRAKRALHERLCARRRSVGRITFQSRQRVRIGVHASTTNRQHQ
jgi:hypothetical protein